MIENEAATRLIIFLGLLTLFALLERLTPRRELNFSKSKRWFNNFGLLVIDSVFVRIIFPTAAVGGALFAYERNIGLLNHFNPGSILSIIIAVLALDLLIYFQHRIFHQVPILWRLHRVHHTDQDFDVATSFRFHPVEILLSMLIKMIAVISLGAPPIAVLIFEIILNSTAIFNHSNWNLSTRIDSWLRLIIVTPDMHRVHHSVVVNETNSNYGFNIPWWDRLFGTYCSQPKAGHTDMVIGIKEFQKEDELRLDKLLIQPLITPPKAKADMK